MFIPVLVQELAEVCSKSGAKNIALAFGVELLTDIVNKLRCIRFRVGDLDAILDAKYLRRRLCCLGIEERCPKFSSSFIGSSIITPVVQ